MDRMRLDKWLWAARFYKTRSLATHEIDAGRVLVGGQSVKPAREIAVDDLIELTNMDAERAKQLIMTARAPWFA